MNDEKENKDLAEEITVTELPEDPNAQADDLGSQKDKKKKGKGKKDKKGKKGKKKK